MGFGRRARPRRLPVPQLDPSLPRRFSVVGQYVRAAFPKANVTMRNGAVAGGAL